MLRFSAPRSQLKLWRRNRLEHGLDVFLCDLLLASELFWELAEIKLFFLNTRALLNLFQHLLARALLLAQVRYSLVNSGKELGKTTGAKRLHWP